MAEIVNLGEYRKKRERVSKKRRAEERRAKFGLTKAQKLQNRKTREKAEREAEGHKMGNGPDGPDDRPA